MKQISLIKNLFSNYIKNLTVYKKMLIMYSGILGTLLVISLIAVRIILNMYDIKLYQTSIKELGYYIDAMETQLLDIEQRSYGIAMDYDMQRQLNEIMLIDDEQKYAYSINNFRTRIIQESINAELVISIIYTDRKNAFYQNGKMHLSVPDDIYQEFLNKCSEAAGGYVYIEPSEQFPYLLSGRDIRHYLNADLRYLGTLIFISEISDIVERNKDVLKVDDTRLYILSDDGIVYGDNVFVDEGFLRTVLDKEYDIVKINKKKYFICHANSDKYSWDYINIVPYDSTFMLSRMMPYLLIVGFILLFAGTVMVIKKVARYITYPLDTLTDTMYIVEQGEFERAKDYLGTGYSTDELGMLQQNFANMLERIQELIRENYEKQILLKDTMYQSLQAQINPHFLYNTLNSVTWMIQAERYQEANQMVISLGELMRQAFSQETMSTVAEEADLLNNYIFIQHIRYENRGRFVMEVEPEAENRMIPRMILQPIVENAIYYGIDQSISICSIHIKICLSNDMVVAEITDDGPGMDTSVLDQVRTFTMKPRGNGIGLKNIYDRLELLYKTDYQFHINSKAGEGTTVTIVLPGTVAEQRNDINIYS
ncbi:two-component system sensor histidine kinase YesM [Hungatella effluvii]|uniref:histidine kinase n=1 Tax=Hungatella effluvii TaxID=1096246 RepID=A0A2V3Y4G4_9FIRM|nr:sensor histidine kinase [Hungatella effluvii]PXX52018.1 two-component system sensor histidine kinase YesM [Hungatella effluvii]